MNLRINGKEATVPEGESLERYLASRGFAPEAVVVELNESIVPRDSWAAVTLKEGDSLEIVSFVGGG